MQFFKRRVYADAAAATPLSKNARKTLVKLSSLYGNPGALSREGVKAKRAVEEARKKVADTVGAHQDEIIFTSGGTEGNNLAIAGVLKKILRERGEAAAVTSSIEHPSVLEVFADLESEGLYTVALTPDSEGRISPKDISESITDETVLVSIQMVNSEIGTIQDIREIAKAVRHARKERKEKNNQLPLYFHTDASQAPLWIRLDVEKLGVDLLTLDGQKIMGPKGVGVLYARRGVALEPVQQGGGQEKGRRSGTENVPLIGSFAVALEEAQQGAEARAEKISKVRDYLIEEIKKKIPEAMLNGAAGEWRVANNCNVSIEGVAGEMLVLSLDAKDVAASARSACASEEESPSHVLTAIGRSHELAKSALRLTLLPNASMRDARYIADSLASTTHRYRNVLE
jgi:cysteine desulfurase